MPHRVLPDNAGSERNLEATTNSRKAGRAPISSVGGTAASHPVGSAR